MISNVSSNCAQQIILEKHGKHSFIRAPGFYYLKTQWAILTVSAIRKTYKPVLHNLLSQGDVSVATVSVRSLPNRAKLYF